MFLKLRGGGHHSCAILESGQVDCYGANAFGQLGYGDMRTRTSAQVEHDGLFVNLGSGRTAAHVTVGEAHNNYGSSSAFSVAFEQDVDLGRGRTATRILANRNHTCALLDNGSVKCWGKGSREQLGFNTAENVGARAGQVGINLHTVDLGKAHAAVDLSVEGFQSWARLDDGKEKCWGLER